MQTKRGIEGRCVAPRSRLPCHPRPVVHVCHEATVLRRMDVLGSSTLAVAVARSHPYERRPLGVMHVWWKQTSHNAPTRIPHVRPRAFAPRTSWRSTSLLHVYYVAPPSTRRRTSSAATRRHAHLEARRLPHRDVQDASVVRTSCECVHARAFGPRAKHRRTVRGPSASLDARESTCRVFGARHRALVAAARRSGQGVGSRPWRMGEWIRSRRRFAGAAGCAGGQAAPAERNRGRGRDGDGRCQPSVHQRRPFFGGCKRPSLLVRTVLLQPSHGLADDWWRRKRAGGTGTPKHLGARPGLVGNQAAGRIKQSRPVARWNERRNKTYQNGGAGESLQSNRDHVAIGGPGEGRQVVRTTRNVAGGGQYLRRFRVRGGRPSNRGRLARSQLVFHVQSVRHDGMEDRIHRLPQGSSRHGPRKRVA
mmetsp:Transcript_8010/g.49480  ORF Transcript_8010/g.49480 Transcript_8010/m.49480 type:complete len:421 (+) Transcript_8010:295-1557(+)